jgi:hypothetical protein
MLRAPIMKGVAAIVSLVVFASCSGPKFPAATPGHQPADTELTTDDTAVYDALTTGYAKDGWVLGTCDAPLSTEEHRALSSKELREISATRQIHLQPETERFAWPYGLPPDMRWPIVGSREGAHIAVPTSVFDGLKSRNQHKASPDSYFPPNLSVIRSSEKPHRSTLALSLPGYSIARNSAIVCVFCTDNSPHCPRIGYFNYLEKRNGIWCLMARRAMWTC